MVLFHFLEPEYNIDEEDEKSENIMSSESEEDLLKISKLEDFQIYTKQIEECKKWFEEYENRSAKVPCVLMLIGKKGCGKSTLAKLLLKHFNYIEKEIPNDDQFTKKQLSELIKNAFIYKNINEYVGQKYGFIFDDIELMLELGDNIIFNEIMTMIKNSKKCDIKKEKSIQDIGKKKKSKKGKDEEKTVAFQEVPLYNPIICTCNYTNDKKMNELRKLCKVIDLDAPLESECEMIINKICKVKDICIDKLIRKDIYEYCEYDIRKIQMCILEITKLKSFQNIITKKEFDIYKLIYGKNDINCQLNDATYKVLQKPLSISDIEELYLLDPLLTPLMIHHNLIDYIKNSNVKNELKSNDKKVENDFEIKFDIYEKCMESICEYDKIQTFIYKNREWDLLPSLTAIESLYIPNLYLQKLEYNLNRGKCKIQFTNILNKISQLEVNKKMVQSAFFSTNRLMIDDEELMYIIEIFLNYLKIDRSIIEYDEGENDNDNENNSNNNHVKSMNVAKSRRIYAEVNSDYEKSEYKKIIDIMNKYNIDLKSLETILKIEKLNLFENKNPKRMSDRMKEELRNFITAQSLSFDEE